MKTLKIEIKIAEIPLNYRRKPDHISQIEQFQQDAPLQLEFSKLGLKLFRH